MPSSGLLRVIGLLEHLDFDDHALVAESMDEMRELLARREIQAELWDLAQRDSRPEVLRLALQFAPTPLGDPALVFRAAVHDLPHVRHAAWDVLGRAACYEALDVASCVAEALAHKDRDVRWDSAHAVTSLATNETRPRFLTLVQRAKSVERDAAVADALGSAERVLAARPPKWELFVDEAPRASVLLAMRSVLGLTPAEVLALKARLPCVVIEPGRDVRYHELALQLTSLGVRAVARRVET
jgi:hypothetical protein